MNNTDLEVKQNDGMSVIHPKGDWIICYSKDINVAIKNYKSFNQTEIVSNFYEPNLCSINYTSINLSETKSLDTFGVLMLLRHFSNNKSEMPKLIEANDAQKATFELVTKTLEQEKTVKPKRANLYFESLGKVTVDVLNEITSMLSFLGEVTLAITKIILKPSLIRKRELVANLQLSALNAIPIICLVNFLIGVVVAYLFASQATQYGAEVYIAELVSIGMFREFSPIVVAVIIAGRSGSAFTAQIGTMNMNEEIDAISVMGLSPLHVLVVPRVLALMIAMPILVFIGDVVGMAGGMLIANNSLGIGPMTFLSRLHILLAKRSFIIGLIKAPVFALFIATIGCKLGFSAKKNAQSVGLNTTSSVVQGITWVIILDAIFAVILQNLEV